MTDGPFLSGLEQMETNSHLSGWEVTTASVRDAPMPHRAATTALGHFAIFWAILYHFGPFCTILYHFGPFGLFWAIWAIFGEFGLFGTILSEMVQNSQESPKEPHDV